MTRLKGAGLSPAQKEQADACVFRMIREGKTVKEIARELDVTCARVHQRLQSHRERVRYDIEQMDDNEFEALHGMSKGAFLDDGRKDREAVAAWLADEAVRARLKSRNPRECDATVHQGRQLGCTLQQIADIMGVSRVRVAQRERAHECRVKASTLRPNMKRTLATPH